MNKVSYHTEDVAYGMKKVIEFALANDDSELKDLTYKQIEDIGHIIAWELAEVKSKEDSQIDKKLDVNSVLFPEDNHIVDFVEEVEKEKCTHEEVAVDHTYTGSKPYSGRCMDCGEKVIVE